MKQIRLSFPMKIAIFMAFVFLVITLVGMRIDYSDRLIENERLELMVEEKQIQIDEIQNKLDTPFDDEYIIELAKEKLGYCLPDEIIFNVDLVN